MKPTKILLALMICFVLGCSSPDILEEKNIGKPGEGSGGGSYASIASQMTTLTTLQSGAATVLTGIRNSPSSYLVTENGLTYIKFQNVTGTSAFNYLNGLRVVYSTQFTPLNWDDSRNEIVQLSAQLKNHTTWVFRSNILSIFDWVKNNINGMTFSQFESGMESRLSSVSNPPKIAGIPNMTPMEQFALTQSYYSLLNQVKWIYQNPTASSSNCAPNWKETVKATLIGGLTAGLTAGWNGIVAGTIATGGHPVGAVVGGLIGFTGGFIGGGVATGGIYLLADCITNKLFSLKRMFSCSGKIAYSYSVAPPIGCTSVSTVDLRSILNIGLVPNKGKAALATSVVNDVNWLLTYL